MKIYFGKQVIHERGMFGLWGISRMSRYIQRFYFFGGELEKVGDVWEHGREINS